uniref:type I restriction enzyme endonuclease domain-containing protein n=1 Tax=Ideonella sp. TaxID=1929293 RepID=UPI0037C0278B
RSADTETLGSKARNGSNGLTPPRQTASSTADCALCRPSLGLGPDEIAFYDALANNESAVRELGDDVLKKIAVEITEKLRASTTVDWQVRESVRAKLRILVRRCLQKWKYPPDKQASAVEEVLKQAETLADGWSS